MRVSTLVPSARLAPWVSRFTIVETVAEAATRLLLPEPGLIVGFRYRGFARDLNRPSQALPDTSLTGLHRSARRMNTSENAGVVLVTFREMGAAHFFNLPSHELYGETIDSRDIVRHSILDRIKSQVAEAHDDAERFSVVAAWLEAGVPSSKGDPLVAAALSALKRSSGGLQTGDLAETLGISRDRLEKRFRHWVGTTPKQLAAIYRMQRVVRLYQTSVSLSELALDAGYFDQAHFTHDFHRFTGYPPRQFFRNVQHC